MRKIGIYLISFFFLIQSSLMAYSSNPKDFINELVNDALSKLSDKNLNKEEGLKFFGAVSWLYDLAILLIEFHQLNSEAPSPDGYPAPVLPGSNGPFIENLLTRDKAKPDFSQLENYGL